MADFDFEMIDEEGLQILKSLQEGIANTYYHIYRSDTAETKTLFSENWSDGKVPTPKELADEEKRQQELKQVFATKEEKEAMQQAKPATA